MALSDKLTVRIIPHDTAKRLTIRILLLVARWLAPAEWQGDIQTLDAVLQTDLTRRSA